jgi:hypothetical protein
MTTLEDRLSHIQGTINAGARQRLGAVRRLVAPRGTARDRALDAVMETRTGEREVRSDVRAVIAAPPKSGNMWLKCLLASTYGLRWLTADDGPKNNTLEGLREYVERGDFKPGTIFHHHYGYSEEIVRLAETTPFALLTVIRDPYDLFVSFYYHMQNFPAKFEAKQDSRHMVIGKPFDHPDVVSYLNDDFGRILRKANAWVHSGKSIVVRYEDLHRDGVGTVIGVTNQIQPVERAAVEQAVEACRASNMRKKINPKHVRKATVGDWQNHLGPQHLAIFRDKYGEMIRSLGYEVR